MPVHVVPNGADVLMQCLIRHGIDVVFAYPGGATLPIHQALTRVKDRLRTILPRHEQGGGFAASAYARSSGKVGVCFATSGPGATNLVTCLDDAHRNAVPLLAITGQVNHKVLGTDAFQEIPIVSMCRLITKHHYLITTPEELPRVIREALHIASTGRPGPVLVDIPKNIQALPIYANFDEPLNLPGYRPDVGEACLAPASDLLEEDASEPHPVVQRLWQLVRDRKQLAKTWLTAGVGSARYWIARSWRFPAAHGCTTTHSLGALGYALSAALGVQAAHPDRTVIAVDTPGSFLSNVQELACAFTEKLPVKVLLLRDDQASDPTDLATVARGFRVQGRRLERVDDLADGLHDMLDSNGPFVLDAALSPETLLEARLRFREEAPELSH